MMRATNIRLLDLVLVAATRAMIGAGAGLLFGGRLGRTPRRAVGATLLAVGALSTIPLAIEIFGRPRATPKTTEVAPGLRVPDAPVADVAPARLA